MKITGFLLPLLLLTGGCAVAPVAPVAPEPIPFQKIVQSAGNRVFPALVYIRVVRENLSDGQSSATEVSGSGVLISATGEVVTNHHVVDKAAGIRCQLNDGRACDATLIGSDKDTDLALLKLQLPPNAPPLTYAGFRSGKAVAEGDFVMAMGAPWGLNRSVSIGIISCAGRYLADAGEYSLWYQTDAAISPGNSGGPLIDTDGKIVGINTLGMSGGGGLGFTVPAATVQEILPRLRQYGKANWAWFGLHFQPLGDFDRNIYLPYKQGVMISNVDAASPAARAGIAANDLLIAVNGTPVTAPSAEALPGLRRMLGLIPFGTAVKFTVRRNSETLVFTAVAAEKGRVEGDEFACERWNFTVKAINRFDTPNLYFYRPEGGVFVYGVAPGGAAARARLLRGDIIVRINGVKIDSLAALKTAYEAAVADLDRNRRASVEILRNGTSVYLILTASNPMN